MRIAVIGSVGSRMGLHDTYDHLIGFLDENQAVYRVLEHAAEGRSEIVSALRGHPASQSTKCIVLMVKLGKKVSRYVLGVVPGDSRVDMDAVKALMQGTHAAFAPRDIAERMAGSVSGSILPFAFNPELTLIVDPAVLEHDVLYFNAGRLDRSLALQTADYVRLAKPRLERIRELPGAGVVA